MHLYKLNAKWNSELSFNILKVFFVCLFTIGLLESGSWALWKYHQKLEINLQGQVAVHSILENPFWKKATLTPHPYTLYWNNPEFEDGKYGRIYDENGYRSDDANFNF